MTDLKHPIELFYEFDLDPNGQIKDLWPSQIDTLNIYFAKHKDQERVALELPTGSGKSIIALILLEMWLRAGKRVGILVSSKELGKDMVRRCNNLGIECSLIYGKEDTTLDSRDRFRNIRNYQRKKTIGIFNYWAYLRGTDIPTAEVLVIDDADNFSYLMNDNFSIIIDRNENEDIYNQIIRHLKEKPIYQRIEQFEIDTNAQFSQLIYYPHSLEVIKLVRKLIYSNNTPKFLGDLYWDFQRNGDKIETYILVIKSDEIIFTPHVIPGEADNIQNVEHLILMSATLGSEDLLHKSIGSQKKISFLRETDLSSEIGTMGDRIIFPLTGGSTSWQTFNELFPKIDQIIAIFRKVAILCNSFNESERLKHHLLTNGVHAWIYGKEMSTETFSELSEGVLIIVGRLIGIDFPDDDCRIEIITRMPFYRDVSDIIARDILDDNDYLIEKTSQRLVQAFGRCNRSPNDCANYFVLDGRLAEDALGNENYVKYFPKRMKAELDYGLENIIKSGLDSAIEIASNLILGKIEDFDEQIQDLSKYVTNYPTKKISYSYLDEINAWYNLSNKKNYLEAGKKFEKCIDSIQEISNPVNRRKKAWFYYLASNCYYLSWIFFKDDEYKKKTIELLKKSIDNGDTSWFSGLQLIINEMENNELENEKLVYDINIQTVKETVLRNCQEYFRDNTSKNRTPRESWERMRNIILKGSHNQIRDELNKTLELMGFEVRIMRRMDGEPDLLLFSNIGDTKYLCLIEIKSKEKDNGEIIAENINQISGNIQKYRNQYPEYVVYPILFTNKEEVHNLAYEKAVNNVRILKAPDFAGFMLEYYDLIEQSSQIESLPEKYALLEKIPTPVDFVTLFTPKEEVIASYDEFRKIIK